MGTVTVLGALNLDIVVGADRHPAVGETVLGHSLDEFPGGKGANQAVAAARAGATVTMVGAVGDDAAGRTLRAFLDAAGVDIGHVRVTAGSPTGTALIVVARADNTIVVVPGANASVTTDRLPDVVAGDGVLLAQLEIPAATTLAALRQAQAAGVRTILNPSPIGALTNDLLAATDVLVLNEVELAAIVTGGHERTGADPPAGTDGPLGAMPSAGGIVAPEPVPHDLAAAVVTLTARHRFTAVVVTLGADGVYLHETGAPPVSLAGWRVPAVDSTGAGDCFVGCLAAALARGETLAGAARFANAAAACSVQVAGAGPSMPTRGAVEAVLAR